MKWFYKGGKSRAVQMAESANDRLLSSRRDVRKDLKKLERVKRDAKALLDRLEFIVETTAEDIEVCEKRLAQAEKGLEALRSEHEVSTTVEIPRLMTALKRFQASDEADIAMSNHRRAGATPISIEGER